MNRRRFAASSMGAALGASLGAALGTSGCQQGQDASHITAGFNGTNPERGHWLRDTLGSGKPLPAPTRTFTTRVLIAGGGVAGLACARALRLRGMDDFVLLELEDSAGGNSRSTTLSGMACPMGAHYLPLPSDDAPEVQDLLEELGLRKRLFGRWQYDERHLCHSPQERLFFQGQWQEGLLPVQGVGAATLAQYQKFAALVAQARAGARWTIPVSNRPPAQAVRALAAITFIAYLDQNGLTDPHLRWYLDYCCRDDYGAGIATVSAWAGIHYFASRHGFHAPGIEGDAAGAGAEGLLTWPEGNAWLTRRLAAPLGERLHIGRVVARIETTRHGVQVDAYNSATHSMERWQAQQVVVALPIFVAARVVHNPPEFLRHAAQQAVYAPWLVANIHIKSALNDRPGAAPAWDNVIYNATPGHGGLGYVDAMHQSLQPVSGATVLTHYRALGDVGPAGQGAGTSAARKRLLQTPWSTWRDQILAELGSAHPDLVVKTTRMEFTRYGHAMVIPVPRKSGQIGLQTNGGERGKLSKSERRISFAHSDWAGYSVFEEAFTGGHRAGQVVGRV
jgi:predicted NAD/FAD-dependent oxidoreductase